MRLLAVRGRNLASLADPFEVDLDAEPLRSAGLFAIAGPTGAGKSTLLDAICLALYDDLPRLNDLDRSAKRADASGQTIGLSDPRSILRHGAAEGFAEVDFLGQDGQRYRARWSVARARGKADGALKKADLRLARLDAQGAEAEVLAEQKRDMLSAVTARIGLSFAQFTRAALLAQGQFDAFLRARANERAELLERVTGAEIYARLSRAAHQRAADERAALKALAAQIAAHAPLDPEARAALDARAAAAADALARARAETAEILRFEDWRAEAVRQAAFARDAAAAADIAEREARSIAAAALAAARRAEAEARAERDAVDAWLTTRAALDPVAAAWPDLRADLTELVKDRAKDQRAERAARAAETTVATARDAQTRAVAEEEDVGARVDAARAEADQTRAAWRAVDPDGLEAARAEIETASRALERAQSADARRADAAADAAQAEAERGTATHAAAAAAAAHAEAEADRPATTDARDAARARLDRWSAAAGDAAARLRALLTAGAPCPVCGARDHDAAPVAAEIDAALAEERAAAAAADQALANLDARSAAAATACASAREAETAATARWTAAHARGRAAVEDRAAALDALGLVDQDAADLAARLADLARTLAERRAALETDLAAARALRGAADAASDQLSKLEAAAAAARAARDTAARAAAEAEAAQLHAQTSAEAARAALDARTKRIDPKLAPVIAEWRAQAPEALIEHLAAELDARAARATRRAELTEALPRLAAETAALEDLTDATPDALDAPPSADAPSRRAALEAQSRAVAARAEAASAAARADAHARAAPPTPSRLAALPADARTAQASADARDATRAAEAAAERARDDARDAVARDQAAQTARAAAEQARVTREAEARVWLQLDELIGSSDGAKFRRAAQELTLARLIDLANARLRDLHPRYRLAPAAEGALALQVIDRDMGDEARGAHNLSGGERFLVSLALALGLAALSSEGGVRVETLFIDEGFGALDPDSLDTALAALEALQATGRRIGVISHVAELRDRIATRIEVRPEGAGRSRIAIVSS